MGAKAWICVVSFLVACVEEPAVNAPPVTASNLTTPAPDPPVVAPTTQDPNAPPPLPARCESPPSGSPDGARVRLTRRGHEPDDLDRWDVLPVGAPCPEDDMPGHLRRFYRPPACIGVPLERFDTMWGEMPRIDRIRMARVLDPSPHRGGWALDVWWEDRHCELSDIGDREVLREDHRAFRDLLDAVRAAATESTP